MSKTMPISEVKTRLPELVSDLEEREDEIVVTRNGKPAAVLVNYEEYERLKETLDVLSDPASMRAESAETIPDLTGAWARTTFALEQPASGPGPLRNPGTVYKGPPAYASPNLKPEAAKVVRERYESTRAGKPFPTPSSTCWPMVAPLIFRVQGMQLLQQNNAECTTIVMVTHSAIHAARAGRTVGMLDGAIQRAPAN